ncbi:MAG: RagB/SusD family nutrient uptake outer membrane protein, partial [Muribaculaceae bacterium]|nr:RagB/SusD family nutrient uptake outer membrane protein [Muribaculaceae bacterium]
MKTIKILGIAMALSMGAVSCSDFLDKENPSESSAGNFWNNKAEAESMLAGCYSVLQEQGLYYKYYNGCDPRALDGFGTTDGASGWWFWSPAEMALTWGNLAPSHELVSTVWKTCYKGIARCNEVICDGPQMRENKIPAEDANRIL